MTELIRRAMRHGGAGPAHVRLDLLWLIAFALLLVASGIGLRDPWPPDEPRFALIARDMLASGDWLIPRVGGDVYADKPPLYFWLLASFLWLTGSIRWSFLLPSLLLSVGTAVLVYDLGRRLWNREVGLQAGLALLISVQFVWQARQAQIDATLCFWTTLGLYSFMRHLLLGPQWRWYFIGWGAAGLGVMTKGVGFLPAMLFLPYLCARLACWPGAARIGPDVRWWFGPPVMLATIGLWLLPLFLAANDRPESIAYLDEILFRQTLERYVGAWHHREPFWYFAVEVIPLLWLPWIALLPWFATQWRVRWRERDLRVMLPLAWAILVVLFFSLSSGKRGVYVLPALPAFALACAPLLSGVIARQGPQRVLHVLAAILGGGTLLVGLAFLFLQEERRLIAAAYGTDPAPFLIASGLGAALIHVVTRAHGGHAAFAACIAWLLLLISYVAGPSMNPFRSGERFIQKVLAQSTDVKELGLVGYKEQFLLYLDRPIVNFGHARWREREQEAADAAAWLAAGSHRALLVDERALPWCFESATVQEVGWSNRQHWFLVRGAANPQCVAKGRRAAIRYLVQPIP